RSRAAGDTGDPGRGSRLGVRGRGSRRGRPRDDRPVDSALTDWSALVKPSLVGVTPYDPGESLSDIKARTGLDSLWKLNWNEGLLGPFDGVLDAVDEELTNAWMYPEQAYGD